MGEMMLNDTMLMMVHFYGSENWTHNDVCAVQIVFG